MINTSLIILIVASLSDLVIPVILGLKYPEYSHLRDTISALGSKESPVKKQENANLILVGILFFLFALGQGFAFEDIGWSHAAYIWGIIAFGIGCIIAGIFPADSVRMEESISNKIHGVGSGIGFLFLILNPLWATFIDAFAEYRLLNTLLFSAGIVTFTLFVMSEKRETGLLQYTGLFQRLNLIVLYGCLILNFTSMAIGN
jgi:hypothetical membrane protein